MGLVISSLKNSIENCGKMMEPSGEPTYRRASAMTPRHPMPGVIYYTGEHPLKSAAKANRINDIYCRFKNNRYQQSRRSSAPIKGHPTMTLEVRFV